MKKLISIILVTVMLAAMIPAAALTATATEAEPAQSGNWTDAGNYDISWASALITDTAKDGESCTIDGNIYTLKYHIGTYEIDTAKKLAGVALLSNSVPGESFSGTVFKITADIDLGEHLWIPIGKDDAHKFRGSIIADSEKTISNMTIVDTASANSSCYGLVGHHGSGQANSDAGVTATGAISNITLTNATINVTNGHVGSIVGRITHGYVDYKNLKSDAKIVCSTGIDSSTGKYITNTNAWNAVGGICGRVDGWGSKIQKFENCVFTGSLDAPTASAVGGIVGVDRMTATNETITFEKCVVVADYIRFGAERPGGHNAWYGGCGGIMGAHIAGDADTNTNGGEKYVGYETDIAILNECYVAINEYTVYAEQDTPTNAHEGVAGMVGNQGNANISFTNCQMDIAVGNSDTATHFATFVGRNMGATTFTSCVNTGIVARIKGASWNTANTFAWSARNPGITDGGNNFASFAQRYGWEVTTSFPTVIESVDTWKTALDSNVWSERTGSIYPILKVAKDYDTYSVSGAGIDYSFFSIDECSVNTIEELRALAVISDSMGVFGGKDYLMATTGANANRVTVAPTLATADFTGFSDSALALIGAKLGKELVAPDGVNDRSKISVQFAQIAVAANVNTEKPDKNGTYNVRVIAKFTDPTVANVYFEYALVQNGAVTKQAESAKITDCYRDVIKEVNGEQTVITAQDGYYVILDIYDVNFKDVTSSVVSVRAYATGADGTVYYSGNYVDITLTSPAAN